MRRILSLLILFVLAAGFARAALPGLVLTQEEERWLAANHNRTFVLGIDPAWPPVEYVDDKGDHRGIAAAYIDYLAGELGLKFQTRTDLLWTEALEEFRSGSVDVLSAVMPTQERSQFTLFTRPYLEFPVAIFMRDDAKPIRSAADLDGRTVAIVDDYAISETLKNDYPGIIASKYQNTRDAIGAVAEGKADAYIDNLATATYGIRELGMSNVQIAGVTPYKLILSMGVNPSLPELRSILDKAIGAIPPAKRTELLEDYLAVGFSYDATETQNRLLAQMQGIYAVSDILRDDASVEERLQRIVSAIPPAFRYPGRAGAAIVTKNNIYKTPRFATSKLLLESPIMGGGTKYGSIQVIYTEDATAESLDVFLPEEKELLNRIASLTGEMIHTEEVSKLNRHNKRIAWACGIAAAVVLLTLLWLTSMRRQIRIRRNAESLLAVSVERFDTIVSNLEAIVFRVALQPELRFEYLSEGMQRVLGYDPADFTSGQRKFLVSVVLPEDAEELKKALNHAVQSGDAFDVHFRARTVTGRIKWIQARGKPMRDRKGRVTTIEGLFYDDTDRRAEQERVRLAAEAGGIGFWSLDLKTQQYEVSGLAALLLGLDSTINATVPVSKWDDMILEEDRDHVRQSRCEIAKVDQTREVEYRVRTAAGAIRWILSKGGTIVAADDGTPLVVGGIHHDITARKTEERLRQQLDKRVKRIISTVPGVVFQLKLSDDGRFGFEFVSERAIDLFGIQAGEMLADHKALLRLVPDEDVEAMQKARDESAATLQSTEQEFRLRTPEGEYKWIRRMMVPFRLDEEKATVWNGVYVDVTEAKQTALELQKERDRAEAATRAKADFLATMSHEIRTPMNAIINMTALTLQTDLSGKQEQYLRTVSSSAKGLLLLINDILDFSKIEAGKLDVESVEMNLKEVLEEVTDTFRDRVIEKHLEFVVHEQLDVPDFVLGDPLRLRQVLINLISNAFKFTKEGEVVLTVSKTRDLPPSVGNNLRRAEIEFAVRDSGIGIPSDKIGRLFQSFSQVDSSTTRKYGGTGLGLAICQKLVQLMGGDRIRVESVEGKGSTFSFALPFFIADSEAMGNEELPKEIANIHALIVEDNEMSRVLLETILQRFGVTTRTVVTSEEAMKLLGVAEGAEQSETWKPDLLVIDWQLPGEDGVTASKRLRQNPAYHDLPIILVSAFAREHEIEKEVDLGRWAFVPKPLKPSLLFDSIMSLFGFGDRGHMRKRREATPAPIDFDGLPILLAEDNEANQFVARELLEAVGMRLDIAENGKLAVEKALGGSYALVLMDVHMPGMDGLQATRELREKGYAPPIIAMTASAMKGDQELCISVGMNDYVSKPIDRDELFRVLRKWITISRMAVRLPKFEKEEIPVISGSATVEAPLPERLPGLEIAEGMSRLGFKPDAFRRMLARFNSGQGEVLEKLRVAVSANDFAASMLHAHSLAGAAGNIGAAELRIASKELELAAKNRNAELAPLFARVEAAAKQVFASIASLGSTKSETKVSAPIDAPAVPADEIRAALNMLRSSLDDCDPETIAGALAPLQKPGIPPTVTNALARIRRLVDDYAYDEAAQKVDDLMKSLEGKT